MQSTVNTQVWAISFCVPLQAVTSSSWGDNNPDDHFITVRNIDVRKSVKNTFLYWKLYFFIVIVLKQGLLDFKTDLFIYLRNYIVINKPSCWIRKTLEDSKLHLCIY